jgi:hypothetical protein
VILGSLRPPPNAERLPGFFLTIYHRRRGGVGPAETFAAEPVGGCWPSAPVGGKGSDPVGVIATVGRFEGYPLDTGRRDLRSGEELIHPSAPRLEEVILILVARLAGELPAMILRRHRF